MADGGRLIVEYDTPDALRDAARIMRARGFDLDAHTPFPVAGLNETLGLRESIIPWAGLVGGVFGIVLALLMQIGTALDYPLNVGGRPPVALPAFLVVTFELLVLFAVIAPIATMLFLNRLPRLHQPLFDVKRFSLASDNRFFLSIALPRLLDRKAVDALLAGTQPRSVETLAS